MTTMATAMDSKHGLWTVFGVLINTIYQEDHYPPFWIVHFNIEHWRQYCYTACLFTTSWCDLCDHGALYRWHLIIKIDTRPEGPMLIILQGLHQISPKEKPYGSKDRKIFMCKCCIIFSPGQQTKAQKLFISWSASVILCPDLLIITDQRGSGQS